MECYYCKGTMVRTKTAYTINKNGYHLVIDDVPAWICQQCGEPYFEGEQVDFIQGGFQSACPPSFSDEFCHACEVAGCSMLNLSVGDYGFCEEDLAYVALGFLQSFGR